MTGTEQRLDEVEERLAELAGALAELLNRFRQHRGACSAETESVLQTLIQQQHKFHTELGQHGARLDVLEGFVYNRTV